MIVAESHIVTKEKIGAVVIEAIYDVMKQNQPYDEKSYAESLRNMVQQCIDFEDTHEILTEWDEWDELVQEGYEAQDDQDCEKMISLWWKAWEIFQKIVEKAEYKISISGLIQCVVKPLALALNLTHK